MFTFHCLYPCQIILDENTKHTNKAGIDLLHQTVLVRSWKDMIRNLFSTEEFRHTRPSLTKRKINQTRLHFFIPPMFFNFSVTPLL